MTEYSEGIMSDGAVILEDGKAMPVEDVVAKLQALTDAGRAVVRARYYSGDDGWGKLKEAIGELEDLVGRPGD